MTLLPGAWPVPADDRGVDIIQNCEVTGFDIEDGKVTGVQTSRGAIKAKKVGVVVAGHCSVLADMAGFRMPVESTVASHGIRTHQTDY